MLYLNDLYRTRAEKAGIIYIDVWDGFVDESGRFVVQGPDFEGQIRRLRVGDGVHFTKAGARKLAHYRRARNPPRDAARTGPVALPTPSRRRRPPAARPGAPAARPLAGPVVPLTALGQRGARNCSAAPATPPPAPADRAATRVLVKGEAVTPPAGRSDDFAWPRRGVAPFGTDPAVAHHHRSGAGHAAGRAGDRQRRKPAARGRRVDARQQRRSQPAAARRSSSRAAAAATAAAATQRRHDSFGGGGFGVRPCSW